MSSGPLDPRTAAVPRTGRTFSPQSVLLLGLCPALAVSTRLSTALWMSAALLAVLLVSTLVSSLAGLAVKGRGAAARWLPAVLAAAAAATGAQLLLRALAPGAAEALGVYLPVLAVNCLVTCRAESAARGEPPAAALLSALVDGAVLAGSMFVIAAVREVLGNGTLTLFPVGSFAGTVVVPGLSAAPARALLLGAGAFIAAGYLAALLSLVGRRRGAASPAAAEKEGRP